MKFLQRGGFLLFLIPALSSCTAQYTEKLINTQSVQLDSWRPPSSNTPSSTGKVGITCQVYKAPTLPLIVVEAETFSPGTYWATCPGSNCGNNLGSGASGSAHLISRESPVAPDPTSRITQVVPLSSTGVWYLWTKSARTGANRQWGVSINGAALPLSFGENAIWENAGSFTAPASSVEIGIFDRAPDAYWSYPDAFILTQDANFSPLLCPNQGANAQDCLAGNHPPELFVRTHDAANAGDTYIPDLQASDPDCDPLTTLWEQISGPSIGSFTATDRNPVFTLPQFTTDTDLTFRVTLSDGKTPPVSAELQLKVLQKIPPPSTHKTCAQITHPYACVEISSCGKLTTANRYYLLTQNLSSDRTCIITRDNVVIDLNGFTIEYDAGYGNTPARTLTNSGFENGLAGWNLSAAPGARIVSTWEMPLIGESTLFVPAGGVIVSDWVELPVANRSYRGSIVQRGPNQPVTLSVERDTGSTPETVCSRSVTDGLGGGKTVFCNFHGKAAGRYRLRVTSSINQYYDDAAIVPALAAGITAVPYFTAWQERPDFVCNLDDGSCFHPDDYAAGNPITSGGSIDVRNGNIQSGSRSLRSYGLRVNGATLIARNLNINVNGTANKAIAAGRAFVFFSSIIANAPWVIDREDISETNSSFGTGSVISDSQFIGGQGNINFSSVDHGVVRRSRLINKATVTNHYAISLGGSEHLRIENNQFNCTFGDASCGQSSGSGITFYRTRNSEVMNNTFNIVSERCDAEYVNGVFSTNGIRLTDYDASVGAPNGVFGNQIHHNVFNLKGIGYPLMPNCDPYGNGIFYSVGAGDNWIENNQFYADNTSSQSATYAFYIGGAHNGGVWKNNQIFANDIPIWYSSAYGPAANGRFIGNEITRTPNPSISLPAEIVPIRLGYCCGYEASNLWLQDNVFGNGFSGFQYSSNQPAPYSFEFRWSVQLNLKRPSGIPIAGARIQLQGASLTAEGRAEGVTEGVTDAQGNLSLVVLDYSQSGTNNWQYTTTNKTDQNPYELRVEIAGTRIHTETLVIHGALSKNLVLNP